MSRFKTYFDQVNQYFRSRPIENIRTCYLCKTEKKDTFNRLYDLLFECNECGFVWLINQPTQDVLDEFYRESRAMDSWDRIKTSGQDDNRQLEKFGYFYNFIEKSNIRSILDYACGSGYFLNNLPIGIDKYGYEVNQASIKNCKYHVYVDKVEMAGKKFDAISCFGILEHVKDPKELINEQSNSLNEAGYIFVIVPNIDSAAFEILREHNCSICPQHLNYFSIDTLVRMFNDSGFSLVSYTTKETEYKAICRKLRGVAPYSKVQFGAIPELPEASIIENNQGAKILAIFKKGIHDVTHSDSTSEDGLEINLGQEFDKAAKQQQRQDSY